MKKFFHWLFRTSHKWCYRADKGEEEHGINYGKRYCSICGKTEHALYRKYGELRIEWIDLDAILKTIFK